MSTAEAVSVAHAMGVYAYYYREGDMVAEDFTDFLVGAAVKDNISDLKRMNHYFESEVAQKKGRGLADRLPTLEVLLPLLRRRRKSLLHRDGVASTCTGVPGFNLVHALPGTGPGHYRRPACHGDPAQPGRRSSPRLNAWYP